MRSIFTASLAFIVLSVAVGCSTVSSVQLQPSLALPQQLVGKAVVLDTTDPEYPRAVMSSAKKDPGKGGISDGIVVKTTEDILLYRLWSGPAKVDAKGLTNRMGSWWSYDALAGTADAYRVNYEICKGWNDLTWAVTCTLKKGAVVAIGPGQSVSSETCEDPSGLESYPANPLMWQVYVDKPWQRSSELQCPPSDYEVDNHDISKQRRDVSQRP